ncbi:DUF317 domain-containing protein [Streptomyces sp. NPDC059278]|uniref:DUF317 domain-containing protein n=1 Tax=Streptomyces sp. NPDC059278 TaxID=3346801 RepID=UPI0036BF449E
MRVERVHDALAKEVAWTVAAYETPVSDRMWALTATGSTPAPVLQDLLFHLAHNDGWAATLGSPVDGKTVTAAMQPLSDAGWKHTMGGRRIHWISPAGDAGFQFDAFAAQHPTQNHGTWTVWAGPSLNRATWTLTASPYTPIALLADLSETLAHGTVTRRSQTNVRAPVSSLLTTPLAAPKAGTHVSRPR